jgi:hypothetical protein
MSRYYEAGRGVVKEYIGDSAAFVEVKLGKVRPPAWITSRRSRPRFE